MEVLYKVTKWDNKESDITEIVPTRQTDKTVWFMIRSAERSERKISNYYQYFDKKEDAISLIKSRNDKAKKDKDDNRIRDSAHDLLDALEDALKTAKFERHPFRPWHKQAEDAIAKARGQ